METIKNAIWGEQKNTEEPVSGKQGAGTTEEPFDKGNEETTTGTIGSGTTDSTATGPESKAPPPQSAPDTSASNRDGPSEATSSDAAGDPSSGQKLSVKQQGAANPHDEPKEDGKPHVPHTDEEREKAMEKGEFPHDPNDHSGEPLKMHGGAEKKEESGDTPDPSSGKKDRSASVSQEGGQPHGQQTGTGEKVVKQQAFAAEGGEFDAALPGASSEGTRLLEEKGIHREAPPGKAAEASKSETSVGSESKTKVSKMDKVKEKLHIKH